MSSKSLSFHDYWFSLPMTERDQVAAKVRTSHAYLEKIASGNAAPSLDMIDRLLKADGRVTFDGIRATWQDGRRRRARKHLC